MKIIFCSNERSEPGQILEQQLAENLYRQQIVICRDIEVLTEALMQRPIEEMIVILSVTGQNELEQFLPILDLLKDFFVILILPECTEGLIAVGHKLQPRFVAFGENDLSTVTSILDRQLKKFNENNKIREV